MSSDLLRRQRGTIKAKLTTTKNFVIRITENLDSTTKEEVETRLQSLNEAYVRFQAISQKLSEHEGEQEHDPEDGTEETEFEDRYFAIKASLIQCLEKLKPTPQASFSGGGSQTSDSALTQLLEQQVTLIQRLSERSTDTSTEFLARILEQQGQMLERIGTQSVGPRESRVKLPIIKLPTFDGTIEDWKRYADTFTTLIHDSDLSNVQKHQYLVGSLTGSAARVIASIQISEQNYIIAWELLKKRYEDDKAIRKRHIQCLFEIPRVQRESATAIRDLVNHVQKHLRVLHSMNLPTNHWGEFIMYLIEKNLDNVTRRRWEEHAETLDNLTTNDIIEFLQLRCQVLERAALSEIPNDNKHKHNSYEKGEKSGQSQQPRFPSKTALATTYQGRCFFCQNQHSIYTCHKFLNLSVQDRIQAIRRLKLCMNCLRNDHITTACRSSMCRECGGRHNTLCHLKSETNWSRDGRGERTNFAVDSSRAASSSIGAERQSSTDNREPSRGLSAHHIRGEPARKQVLMSTAIVTADGSNNHNYQLRVLLDSASEANFITIAASKKLGSKLDNICETINGLGAMNCAIKNGCQVKLKSRTSNYELNLYCLVVPQITKDLPSFSICIEQLPIPGNLKLADPCFHNPNNIDILMGGEFFLQLLENGKIELSENLPTLQNSKLGWIIAGPIPEQLIDNASINHSTSNVYTCLSLQQNSVNETFSKFWELEEYTVDKFVKLSREELQCENQFVSTKSRDASGRFVVKLPFRETKTNLGDSREMAMKRLNYLERKFNRDPSFHKHYSDFMQEYISLNHMSKASENSNETTVYLPHHGVLRETSTTTKLRVVFDGSAKTTSGFSLNDTLMVGANLQDNIIDIILRFRLHAIAITADLKKMYRQIMVHEDDRDYQRILWRFSTNEPVQEFRLNTVTYGLACAPFLAIRCVRELASNATIVHNEASQVLLNDLYVDDILTGVDNMTDASDLIAQLKSLLRHGGFETHKWRSNCPEILDSLDKNEQVVKSFNVTTEASNPRTLGLNWLPEQDIFEFSIESITTASRTKREVLSAISRLFDPLGLVSPILIRAKLTMQGTWLANLNWDEPLTDNLQQTWDAYVGDLKDINTIQIQVESRQETIADDFTCTHFAMHH